MRTMKIRNTIERKVKCLAQSMTIARVGWGKMLHCIQIILSRKSTHIQTNIYTDSFLQFVYKIIMKLNDCVVHDSSLYAYHSASIKSD